MPPAFFSSPFGFAAPEAEQQQQQGPAPGEGQGFVLLEDSEAIGAEMLRQAQEEAEGQAEGQEYELAQLNRCPDAAAHGDSGSEEGSEADEEEEEEEEEEEDTLSLSELPKDLRGLCRRLRGEQPSSDEEEEEEEGAEGSPVTAAAGANRRKGKGSSKKKPARRSGAAAAKGAASTATPAQAAFLCWAWPVSAREALFWLVAAAFLASFALIALGGAGGRYRAHYHAMGMGRTRAGMAHRACPASAAPSAADPFFGSFGGSPSSSAWASSPPGQEQAGEGNHNGPSPLFVAPAEARRLLARAQAAEAEAGALKAERRDREEELAWMRSAQYGLETQVRCLKTQLSRARQENALLHAHAAATTAPTTSSEPGEEEQQQQHQPTIAAEAAYPPPPRPSPRPLRVPTVVKTIPEVHVVQQPAPTPKPTPATATGSPNTSHFFPSFHPPLWFVTPGAPLAMGQQQPQSTAAAAAKAAKPKAPVPPPQSAPKSYAAAEEEEEDDMEGWSDDEDWSDSEWEEDWSSDEEDDGWTDSDEEWDDWSDEDWSDSDDEEWDGEWEEWEAVEQCEAPASSTTSTNNARTPAASTWAEPPFCPAVQTAPKAPCMGAAKYPLEFADLCPAPVSPLLQ